MRLIDRGILDCNRRAPYLDGRELARIERRHDVELGLEGERLALFNLDVADVGRLDRLDAALGQRLFNRALDELVGDIVENLALEALAHDLGRHLAGRNPGSRAAFP